MSKSNPIPLDDPSVISLLSNTKAHTILNDRLYLGPASSASNETALLSDGITHILNITKEIPKQQFTDIQVCHLHCYDSPQQCLPFEEAAAFIDECLNSTVVEGRSPRRCLIHCNAGQSRSASITIYYLMTKGHTLQQSYEYVKSRKPNIRPNYGFCSQLQEMEVQLFGGKTSLDMNEYKADTLCEILEGSNKTREDILKALKDHGGDGEIALGMLLQ